MLPYLRWLSTNYSNNKDAEIARLLDSHSLVAAQQITYH